MISMDALYSSMCELIFVMFRLVIKVKYPKVMWYGSTFLQAKTFTKRRKTKVNKDTSEVMENGD